MSIQLGVAILIYVLADLALVRGGEKLKGLTLTALMFCALLFIICPLIYSPTEGYFNIGEFKYKYYVVFAAGFLTSALILLLKAGSLRDELKVVHPTDMLALCFLMFVFLSFLFSGDLMASFFGSENWRTGFLFQFVIVCIYLIASRYLEYNNLWLRAVLLAGCFIFAVGILHRFSIDPLGLYENVDPYGQIRFLSTIGQATWYSRYLCLVFPLGIYLFLVAPKNVDLVISGVFVVLGSMSLVTQNSDSAYIAVFMEFVVLIFLCILCRKSVMRLGITVMMISVSVLITGLLEQFFAESFAKIDPLSIWVAQGPLPYAGIILGGGLYFFSRVIRSRSELFAKRSAGVFLVLCLLLTLGALGCLFAGNLATDGVLSGYNPFDKSFGNGRGLIWKRTFEMYADLPAWRKIIGIGPGMYARYIKKYTELELQNAHCELLTILVESGIGAAIMYAALHVMSVVTAARSAYKSMDKERCILLIALAAVFAGNIGHGFSSDQQTLTTPMVFALMGLAANLSAKERVTK